MGGDRQGLPVLHSLLLGDDTLANDRPELVFRTCFALALGALLGLLGRPLALLLLSLTLDE